MIGFSDVAVIGGGAWGAALAHLSAGNGVRTRLWAREPEVVASVNTIHENASFLPGVRLHDGVVATASLADAAQAEAMILVAPVQHLRAVLGAMPRRDGADVLLCCKGLETGTRLFPADIVGALWPSARVAALSGPSFARDVARGLPTAVTLASRDETAARRWSLTVGAAHFRPYLSDDVVGVELGGAVKNVLAIAAGVVDGKGLGESARAALVARGFAEFQRLGVALGARRETMAGLSGLGDLILTANSPSSRNMSLGMALGRGETLTSVLAARNSVAEGVATAGAVAALAAERGVEAPICQAVADLVSGARDVDATIAALLARPFRSETS